MLLPAGIMGVLERQYDDKIYENDQQDATV